MTHRVRAPRGQIPRAWLIPLGGAVAILASVAADVMSRAVAADFLAWWPVWIGLAALAFLGRSKRIGSIRVSGLVPLLATAALALFVGAYFLGWPVMPSASIRLDGPPPDAVETAVLSARIDGDLRVSVADVGPLYTIEPLRSGGDVGSATAVEQTQGASFSVSLEPELDPGVYRYAGWSLSVNGSLQWGLTLEGSTVADLGALRLSELRLVGDGRVTLGAPNGATPVSLDGDFMLAVPAGVPAEVIGQAAVPSDWVMTSDGWRAPVDGDGWVISPGPGASLSVSTH